MLRRRSVCTVARLFSTLVGKSGREYTSIKPLQVNHPKGPKYNIHLAGSGGQGFVIKPVSSHVFERLQEVKEVFGHHPSIRHHVDQVDDVDNPIVIYEYYHCHALDLMRNETEYPLQLRKKIIRDTGSALQCIHENGWMHGDNVFLKAWWESEGEQRPYLDLVSLGDMDDSFMIPDDMTCDYELGNVRWRSPEGQLAKRINRPSEVFSFGLFSLFIITRVHIHLNFDNVDPEIKVPYLALRQLLQNYGPVPSSLLDHFQDEESKGIVRKITDQINEQDLYEPIGDMAFPNWDEAAKSFVLSMTKLDPKQRPTMKEVLEHPYLKDP